MYLYKFALDVTQWILNIYYYCWHSLVDSFLKLIKQRRHYFCSGGLFSSKNLSSGSLRFAAALLSFPLSQHVTTWNSSRSFITGLSLKWNRVEPPIQKLRGMMHVTNRKSEISFCKWTTVVFSFNVLMVRFLSVIGAEDAWIGGTDERHEGIWVWLYGEDPFTYSNWDSGKTKEVSRCHKFRQVQISR